ncbi:MAG: ankyrin repeat domain-containing protein, partial [Rickettsia sp.]|nr:ankyrin repeat domain-containing protein [Rickettsia sp.]
MKKILLKFSLLLSIFVVSVIQATSYKEIAYIKEFTIESNNKEQEKKIEEAKERLEEEYQKFLAFKKDLKSQLNILNSDLLKIQDDVLNIIQQIREKNIKYNQYYTKEDKEILDANLNTVNTIFISDIETIETKIKNILIDIDNLRSNSVQSEKLFIEDLIKTIKIDIDLLEEAIYITLSEYENRQNSLIQDFIDLSKEVKALLENIIIDLSTNVSKLRIILEQLKNNNIKNDFDHLEDFNKLIKTIEQELVKVDSLSTYVIAETATRLQEQHYELQNFKFNFSNNIANAAKKAVIVTTSSQKRILHYAAEYDSVELAEFMLDHGAEINAQSSLGLTPLAMAALNNKLATGELLLKKHANVNLEDSNDQTPLHAATWLNYAQFVNLLINYGANLNAKDKEGETALHYAIVKNYVDIANILIANKADLNAQNQLQRAALHYTVSYRTPIIMDTLIQANLQDPELNLNLNIQDQNGDTALHMASSSGYLDLTTKLLDTEGTDINFKNNKGETALHYTILQGDSRLNIISLLVKRNADINIQNLENKTALHYAASSENRINIANFLINQGIKINLQDYNGQTALHYASIKNYIDLAKKLTMYGGNLLLKDNTQKTACDYAKTNKMKDIVCNLDYSPLHDAIMNNPDLVNDIISNITDINVLDNFNNTALHIAARKNDAISAQLLIDAGIDKEFKNYDGDTALHITGKYNSVDVTRILIDAKSNLNAQNNNNITTLMFASLHNSPQITQALIDTITYNNIEKVNLDLQDNEGETALHKAVWNNFPDIAQMLIDSQANLNLQDNEGETALHKATNKNLPNIVEKLINAEANLDIQTNRGDSPLHRTAIGNITSIATLLIQAGANTELKEKDFSQTALHLAVIYNNPDVAEIFLNGGANKDSTNIQNQTPLHLTAMFNTPQITTMLLNKNANIEAIDLYELQTALNYTAIYDSPEVTRLLIAAGANLDSKDQHGKTSLHNASDKNHLLVAELLVNAGANLYAKDDKNFIACDLAKTNEMRNIVCNSYTNHSYPLHLAVSNNDKVTAEQLIKAGANINLQDKNQ